MKQWIFLSIIFVFATAYVRGTCLSEKEIAERGLFGKVIHNVGCTIHKGAQHVGEGVQRGFNILRGRGSGTTPKPIPPTTPEYKLDIRGNFEGRSADIAVESTTFKIDGRMLFVAPSRCPDGYFTDHRNRCRAG